MEFRPRPKWAVTSPSPTCSASSMRSSSGRHLQVHEGRLCQRRGAGVYDALPYLISNANRLLGFEKAQADYIDFAGKQVVVLGAATPPWTACTAIRQGADQVICAYRRDAENMPGSKREVKTPRRKGGVMFNLQPVGVELDAHGPPAASRW